MAELSLGWKLWADISQFTSSMKKAKDESVESTNKIGGSFRDMSKKLSAAKRDYLDLAAALGPHNKAVAEAKTKLEALQKEYDSIKVGSGKSTSSFAELKTSVLAVGAAVGSLSAVTAIANKVIASSSALSDKWAETSTSAEWALGAMFRTIATGDWSNFLSNIRVAIDAGAEYARILDDVEDKQRALQVQDAKTTLEIEKLDRVVKNVNASYAERIAAVDAQNKLESDLSTSRKEAARGEYAAALLQISTQTKLGEATIKNFLENKKGARQLKADGKAYLDLQKQINDELQSASESYTPDMGFIDGLRKQQSALGSEAKAASVVIERMGAGADGAIDQMIEKWSALYSTETEYLQATERGAMRKETFLKSLTKQTKVYTEAIDAQTAATNRQNYLMGLRTGAVAGPVVPDTFGQLGGGQEVIGAIPGLGMPLLGIGGLPSTLVGTTAKSGGGVDPVAETQKLVSEISQILSNGLSPVFTNVFNSIGNLMVKFKEGFKGGLTEIIGAVADVTASVLSAIVSIVNEAYENKMAKLDAWYEKEKDYINGSVMNEAQKRSKLAKLDLEADKKRRELQYKQAKDNKTMAIMQAVINGALAVTAAMTTPGVGIVMGIIAGILAAAQIAIIASQPLPALAQGGLAYAPTMAMVGDNPNASVDPEVIAPLSKLRGIMGGGGGGQLTAVVRGEDLVFMLERAENKTKRWA